MKKGNPWIDICPGIKRQTITSGRTMYQMLAKLGSRMPEHRRPSARRATNIWQLTKNRGRNCSGAL
jgi:hypothetical protein